MNRYKPQMLANKMTQYHDQKEAPELAFISKRLHSIVVNSTSIEYLFSDIGFIYSKYRQVHLQRDNLQPINMNTNNKVSTNMENEVSVNIESNINKIVEEIDNTDKEVESDLILKLDGEVYETDYDLDNIEALYLADNP
ncbi:19043_t:CDS:2 [Racocetra persica]|uniref:19043_t:CDS:1 n=1 Tax=Racocetra persica TaxID=160502 RepID=A0ACA9PK60_9GLOM|nr:19043_t:CDS:2 [Racocetra persica]